MHGTSHVKQTRFKKKEMQWSTVSVCNVQIKSEIWSSWHVPHFLLEEKIKEICENCPMLLKWDDCFSLSKMFCNINVSLMTFVICSMINACQSPALASVAVWDNNRHDPSLLHRLDSFITQCHCQFASLIHKPFLPPLLSKFVLAAIFINSGDLWVIASLQERELGTLPWGYQMRATVSFQGRLPVRDLLNLQLPQWQISAYKTVVGRLLLNLEASYFIFCQHHKEFRWLCKTRALKFKKKKKATLNRFSCSDSNLSFICETKRERKKRRVINEWRRRIWEELSGIPSTQPEMTAPKSHALIKRELLAVLKQNA